MHPLRTFRSLGPGLIFAAAAIGVSHLVQSTRAGVTLGLLAAPLIVAANAAKYPAFRFGPQFASATGHSLLHGYRLQGRWALYLFFALTIATMFTVQAAVTLVTAALLGVLLPGELSTLPLSAGLLVVGGTILATGGYALLDRITKFLVILLSIATLVATIRVVPVIDWGAELNSITPTEIGANLAFVVALVGWMPSAIDVSVWQSMWTRAGSAETSAPTSSDLQRSMFDFHVGYIGTAVLALCFMLLGMGVASGGTEAMPTGAVGFAVAFLDMYAATFGAWARPLVGIAAAAVMCSTTLAVLDGFPRALCAWTYSIREMEAPDGDLSRNPQARRIWLAFMLALSFGALVIVAYLGSSLARMVDLATTVSFLTAPVLALLNHRSMFLDVVPSWARPSRAVELLSIFGIVAMSGLALVFIVFG